MWVYPPIGAELVMVGLEEISLYITRHQNMVAQYIATCPIMDLCLAADWRPGMRISQIWWEHPVLDTLGIRATHAAAEMGGETGREESERERD